MKILSSASPSFPIQIDVSWGEWHDGAFDGEVVSIHCPPPIPFQRRKRTVRPMSLPEPPREPEVDRELIDDGLGNSDLNE